MSAIDERPLRLAAVAAELGCSISTVRRAIDRGELLARRTPGGQRVVERAELDRYKTAGAAS